MKNRTTGKDQVRAALERGERLTHLDALNRWGLWHLAVAIFALKREGMAIDTELIQVTTRNGDTARVAQYSLAQPAATAAQHSDTSAHA